MVRDEEIRRLISYAKGLGASVKFTPRKGRGDGASWDLLTDNSVIITIFTKENTSKIDIILSLIHEIGHHKDYIHYGRRLRPAIENLPETGKLTKKQRKDIYKDEVAGTRHWENIYRETGCAFNIQKLLKTAEFDTWQYFHFSETGKYPSKIQIADKLKTLRAKHNC